VAKTKQGNMMTSEKAPRVGVAHRSAHGWYLSMDFVCIKRWRLGMRIIRLFPESFFAGGGGKSGKFRPRRCGFNDRTLFSSFAEKISTRAQ